MIVRRTLRRLLTCSLALLGGAAALPPAPAHAAVQATLYAAPAGSGSACTQAAPCTLDGARARVRTLTVRQTGDVVVLLRGGTYRLTAPFALTDDGTTRDSGRNGHFVAYRNYPGERPVLSGGTQVTGWTLHDAAKGIWRAPVGRLTSRQVWVDGVPAVRARTRSDPGGFTETPTGFTHPNDWTGFAHPRDLEVVANIEYHHHRCRVTGVTRTGGRSTITLAQPCVGNTKFAFGYGPVAWIENAYELLDRPGEYHLDTHSTPHVLYYKPRRTETLTGSAPSTVVAGQASALLTATGTAATPLRRLELSGLTFAHTSWDGPAGPDGYVTEGAGNRIVGAGAAVEDDPSDLVNTPAAVTLRHVIHARLHRNVFTRLGSAGLAVVDASARVLVRGNSFTDVAGNGVTIAGTAVQDHHPTDVAQRTYGITVDNNLIERAGTVFSDSVGVFSGFADTVTISHNDIGDLPYTGIWDGHGYGRMDVGGQYGYRTPTTHHRHTIVGNHVHDVMKVLRDGGGIYTEGDSPSSTITGNYVHNVRTVQAGIYIDEQSSYWTATGNVVRSAPYWLTMQGNTSQNTVRGNWADTNRANLIAASGTQNTITGNAVFSDAAVPAAARAVMDAAGLQGAFRRLLPVRAYRFDDVTGTQVALTGVHGGVDFGRGAWRVNNPGTGYALTGHAYVATETGQQSFRLPAGTVLRSLRLAGTGTYRISDGTRTVTGSLPGNATAVTVTTGWTVAAPVITVTLSARYDTVLDDVVYAPVV